MKTLANTLQQTTAEPRKIFALWEDINHWNEYDQGIEWAKLDGSFRAGENYTLKPKGGPKVRATILEVVSNQKFVDVSHLFGAKLMFNHTLTRENTMTNVAVTMTVSGPLGWLWARILGKNQQADIEQSTTNLIAKAESQG